MKPLIEADTLVGLRRSLAKHGPFVPAVNSLKSDVGDSKVSGTVWPVKRFVESTLVALLLQWAIPADRAHAQQFGIDRVRFSRYGVEHGVVAEHAWQS